MVINVFCWFISSFVFCDILLWEAIGNLGSCWNVCVIVKALIGFDFFRVLVIRCCLVIIFGGICTTC